MTEKKRGGLRSPAGGRPRKEPTVVLSFRVPEKYKDIIKQHIDNLLKNTIMNTEKNPLKNESQPANEHRRVLGSVI